MTRPYRKRRTREQKAAEMSRRVSKVYLHVVDDVIDNVRSEFHSEGLDDNILDQLQSKWELKLVQSGVVQEDSGLDSPEAQPVQEAQPKSEPVDEIPEHYQNGTHLVSEEPYVAPPSDVMFGRMNPSTGRMELVRFQHIPAGPSEEFMRQNSVHHLPLRMGNGTPIPYMQQPAPWMNQNRRGVELNMNETYVKREEGDNFLAQRPFLAPPFTQQTQQFPQNQYVHHIGSVPMNNVNQARPGAQGSMAPATGTAHYGNMQNLGVAQQHNMQQQPAPWMNQNRRGVELNMNETYVKREEGDNGLVQRPVRVISTALGGQPPNTQDFQTRSTGKRKRDNSSSGYYFPQRDGATDGATDDELGTSVGDASNIEATGEFKF